MIDARGKITVFETEAADEWSERPLVGVCGSFSSVEELAHMNRIRFSTSSQNSIIDSDDP